MSTGREDDEARAEADRLRQALAPLVACVDEYHEWVDDAEPLYVLTGDLGNNLAAGECVPDFTMGDLRRAAALLLNNLTGVR